MYFRKHDEVISVDTTELCSQIWRLKLESGSFLMTTKSIKYHLVINQTITL